MPDINPATAQEDTTKPALSHSLVLFGALGDLSLRKLMPALYRLEEAQLLSDDLQIMAVARSAIDQQQLRQRITDCLHQYIGSSNQLQKDTLLRFLQRLSYCQIDLTKPQDYLKLSQQLGSWHPQITFYLATPPDLYSSICDHLHSASAITERCRIMVEKPIGHDLASSIIINDKLGQYFDENQIFRIDHYLGKETVQNLIALRFANPLFESQWNHQYIDYVEISVAEDVGIEGRWGYFDKAGQMRDMVQNHLLQLLCMVAMDPPSQLCANSIRDEKVQVLKALKPIPLDAVDKHLVLGQYTDGQHQGDAAPGYLNEADANIHSNTETFLALRAEISNWRWNGTPFYLRTGKRMAEKVTEIIIHYKPDGHFIFSEEQATIAQNKLVIRLQPYESISLQVLTKEPGIDKSMQLRRDPLHLDFAQTQSQARIPDAYERLLLEALKGNQSLFVRRDEVELAWQWCDQIRQAWKTAKLPLDIYAAGSNGPQQACNMIENHGHRWYEHCNETNYYRSDKPSNLPNNIQWQTHSSAEQLANTLAATIAQQLHLTLEESPRASLAISGGRTPKAMLQQLSQQQIDWSRVDITLADERWVNDKDNSSNGALVKKFLLQNHAAKATFYPLFTGENSAAAGQAHCQQQLKNMHWPLSVLVLGMGNDGHTASLFPLCPALPRALSTTDICIATQAPTSPADRITLSANSLMNAKHTHLHIEGMAKLQALELAIQLHDPKQMPIFTFLQQSINIHWCP
ncbi:MAG: glucose-6-phosphate dehydrogenase [Gammaproteobacteria bacterium]|nr:glucose-6-phosphate dehydrogenase [Gammaproteobacteria bacterium]